MKILVRIIAVFIFLSQSLYSQELITLDLGEQYRVTERQNLRIRVNGRYKGYLYREYRGFLRQESDNEKHYKGKEN